MQSGVKSKLMIWLYQSKNSQLLEGNQTNGNRLPIKRDDEIRPPNMTLVFSFIPFSTAHQKSDEINKMR